MSLDAGGDVESLHKPIYQKDGQEISLMDKLEEKSEEHEQIQNKKARGLTDDEIDNLGKSGKYEEQMRFYSEEDDDENKND